jgi:hypothetical protein
MIRWLADVLHLPRPETPRTGLDPDEMRESKALRAEQKRHVDAIERHVNAVASRVREDAHDAEQRLSRR